MNRPPVITSATISPAFGIQELTTFTFAAQASDPDGDAIAYRWELPTGTASDAQSFTAAYRNGGDTDARVTVTASLIFIFVPLDAETAGIASQDEHGRSQSSRTKPI